MPPKELTIDELYDSFYEIIYDPHSSYINSFNNTQDNIDDFCKNLEWEHQPGISDDFIGSLFEKVDFEVFSDDAAKKKHILDNWDSLNEHIITIYQDFDNQSSEIVFNSTNEKIFFKWFVGYFADRLGAGHNIIL